MTDKTAEIIMTGAPARVPVLVPRRPGPESSLADQRLLSTGKSAVSYAGNGGVCHVVMDITESSTLDETILRQRLKLIQLVDRRTISRVDRFDLRSRPVSVWMESMHRGIDGTPLPLASVDDQISLDMRLPIAGQILGTVRQAHRFGLIHGNLSLETIHLVKPNITPEPDGGHAVEIRIDYSGIDYGLGHANIASRAAAQTLNQSAINCDALPRLLSRWLTPMLESDEASIGGRDRARLRQALCVDQAAGTLDHWLEIFQPWLPEEVQRTAETSKRRPLAVGDTGTGETGEVAVVSIHGRDASFNEDDSTERLDARNDPTNQHGHERRILPRGTVLGRYQTESLIGVGGMGTVYHGTDQINGESVAIKVLHEGPNMEQAVRRFRKEARI